MLARLSLRQRIFLFFAALACGSVAITLGAAWFGAARAQSGGPGAGLATTAILSSFGILGLTAGIWLLFDENVAKPIEALAADLRARAHGGVRAPIAPAAARHLGDLAPAADAIATALQSETLDAAARVATETARLEAERNRLTALLTDIPVATVLVGATDQIVLYDGQAAEVLAQIAPPRLGAHITDYFTTDSWAALRKSADRTGKDAHGALPGRTGGQRFASRLRPMPDGGAMLIIDDQTLTIAPEAARPLVYDFTLFDRTIPQPQMDTALADLCFSVFDSETTGLLPHKDDVVQLGAVRVIGGRIVPGEAIDTLVNPGRPIPPASTAVHGVSDAMVTDAPDIVAVGQRFHAFCTGAVIVAHNAPFDMAFLRRDAGRMGVAWDHPILDTVLLSAVVFGASQTHTLDALCNRLGIAIDERLRHTALGDAMATAEALIALVPMLEARGMKTLGDVIGETRRHGRLLADQN